MFGDKPFMPSCFFMNRGENSAHVALSLTKAPHRFVVRMTGGCGYMSEADAAGLYDLFAEAFTGYRGAMLFGGTRMILRSNPGTVVPGITEIPPILRKQNPDMIIFGFVPRTDSIVLDFKRGFLVTDESENPYVTIPHPEQDFFALIQTSVDMPATWDDEYLECLSVVQSLREYSGWRSLLVVYNGGSVTEKEILAIAKRGWPVLLIRGSGRIADRYAGDAEFLKQNPSVLVCEKDAGSLRQALMGIGALTGIPGQLRVIRGEKAA